jgi:hypothetical protein
MKCAYMRKHLFRGFKDYIPSLSELQEEAVLLGCNIDFSGLPSSIVSRLALVYCLDYYKVFNNMDGYNVVFYDNLIKNGFDSVLSKGGSSFGLDDFNQDRLLYGWKDSLSASEIGSIKNVLTLFDIRNFIKNIEV